jgi:hypothetical protein
MSFSPPNIFEGAVDLGHLGALIGTSTRLPYPFQPLTNATYNPYFYQFSLDVNDGFVGVLQSGATSSSIIPAGSYLPPAATSR